MRRSTLTTLARWLVLTAAMAVAASSLQAQTPRKPTPPTSNEGRIRSQRDELERVRKERAALEQRMRSIQGTVHSLSEEVQNLDRQADATARLVQTLDTQLSTITDEVESASSQLVRAEDELTAKRATLHKRLIDIYKRGPLYSLEALLSAQSFASLVARYKYLHVLTLRDRALVGRVEELRDQIGLQRTRLVRLQDDVQRNRSEKAMEEQRLRSLEQMRGRNLKQVQRSAEQIKARLAQIARDEARLSGLITSLEAERKRAAARPNARPSTPSSLRTADLGRLDWPVEGNILYQFGRVVNPNNTTTRWNGIGIGAATGTPVRSVSAGTVVVSEPIGTYGLTVIVQHGGGDYSVYGSLSRADVKKGATVTKGQSVGTVGVSDPELPPHLHFEMRPQGRAVDPLDWLRGKR